MPTYQTLSAITTTGAMLASLFSLSPSPKIDSQLLATHEISLENRYSEPSVNEVFKDNILLTLSYIGGKVENPKAVNWNEVRKPFRYEFSLKPKEAFAFHDDVLAEYSGKIVKTTNSHFNFQEGFKSDGYLFGDGVCHLASLLYWAAKDAGLNAKALTNHNFMPIPEIPKEYGVSIFSMPGQPGTSRVQNLYITNTREEPVVFQFDYDGKNLTVTVSTPN